MDRPSWAGVGRWAVGLVGAALVGCGEVPSGSIVLTQVPVNPVQVQTPGGGPDERYPAGSRVVLLLAPAAQGGIRILSKGLVAAGDPIVAPAADRVLFVGRRRSGDDWQVYETPLTGGRPKQVTYVSGGAASPALLANGSVVFSSPTPKTKDLWGNKTGIAIYKQAPGGTPKRLTYGLSAAIEPTVMADGRILFVSAHPSRDDAASPSLGLFTINDDGTELTAFAADHDGAPEIHRPRELLDGRVAFLARPGAGSGCGTVIEAVQKARPFASRRPLFAAPIGQCGSIEPRGPNELLVCASGPAADGKFVSMGVFQVERPNDSLGKPVFNDPSWRTVEAVPVQPREAPTGHVSAMATEKNTGTILCLNVNFTRGPGHDARSRATRVRVLTGRSPGNVQVLGEVRVQTDGSFMARVPADTPLGFESLDANGQVLQRLAPVLWVRAGENRSCIGCHEPSNRSPRNARPLAVLEPPVDLIPRDLP